MGIWWFWSHGILHSEFVLTGLNWEEYYLFAAYLLDFILRHFLYTNSVYFPCSCAPCIHTIPKSCWMNWDLLLSCWILENSQIAWIFEVALVPHFFMLSILHLILCHQSLLVYLSLIRKYWMDLDSQKIGFTYCISKFLFY